MLSAAAAGQLCACHGSGDPVCISRSEKLMDVLAGELGYETLGCLVASNDDGSQEKPPRRTWLWEEEEERHPVFGRSDYYTMKAVEFLHDRKLDAN